MLNERSLQGQNPALGYHYHPRVARRSVSGIFKSEDPARRGRAIVQAVTHYNDPQIIAEVSKGLGEPMRGLELAAIPEAERLATRGW